MEPNNGNLYYYLKDALGNIIGLAAFLDDYYYEVKVEYKYDAWGNLVETTGPLSSTVGAQNPFLYKGYYFDRETGYYYLQSRYYSPEWCRFINADDPNNLSANGDHSSVNLFAYCNNNPVIYSDPDGEIAIAIPIILKALGMAILTTLVVIAISYLAKTAAPSFSGFVNHMVTQTKRILSPVKILAIIPALLQNLQYRAITAAVRRGLSMVELSKIKDSISTKIKTKNGKIDLGKFSKKPGSGPPRWIGPLGYELVKDMSEHKGPAYKLFRWGVRIATILLDGTIIGP